MGIEANAYRGGESFPLREALRGAKPLHRLTVGSVVQADTVVAVRLDRLVYFALSIFWKAAACQWSCYDHLSQLELGLYAEHIRRFLFQGEPLPKNVALVVNVSGNSNPHVCALYPYESRAAGARQHRFAIPGLAPSQGDRDCEFAGVFPSTKGLGQIRLLRFR